MESQSEDQVAKLIRAQTHIHNHALSFINSMSLKCAIDLSIPDIIHNYGQPMPISQLIASLQIHPSKTESIYRLMRVLTHSDFFSQQNEQEEVMYQLTDASKFLLKDHPLSLTHFLNLMVDPFLSKPWHQLSNWFKNEDPTPFHTENGMAVWDYASRDFEFNRVFNEAMASDTQLVSTVVIEKCKGVFKGLKSLVDVGGGTGTLTKAIAKSFPQLECIVFDLPHVVAGMQGTENLNYVGGNMFEAIPMADSILLKTVLHDWDDEECVKILKKCKEAITTGQEKGKVIIIEMVIIENDDERDDEIVETELFHDMLMMVMLNGKERNEKQWANLIFSAGFSNYKVTPILGLKSLIEVYP